MVLQQLKIIWITIKILLLTGMAEQGVVGELWPPKLFIAILIFCSSKYI